MTSLLLDCAEWDLCVDQNGDLAICSTPYSVTQDVACALRTFLGECFYDTARGIPYFTQVLGRGHAEVEFKSRAEDIAAAVPGVASGRCFISPAASDRRLHGLISLNLEGGGMTHVAF